MPRQNRSTAAVGRVPRVGTIAAAVTVALAVLRRLLPILSLTGLLPGLLTVLSLLPRLPLLRFSTIAGLITGLTALQRIRLAILALALPRLLSAVLLALPLTALRELLHPVAHGFQAFERALQIFVVAAGPLTGLAGLRLHRGLRLLELIAQIVQAVADAVLAQPCLRSVALTDETGVLAHVHFEFVLLRLAQGVAQFVPDRILRARHAARGIRHALLQLLELIRHLRLFAGQAIGLLLILETLRTEARILAAGSGDHLAQTILRVRFLLRELIRLLRERFELLRRILVLHPVQNVACFLQPIGSAALARGSLLWTAVLLTGVLHVFGGFFQTIQRLL